MSSRTVSELKGRQFVASIGEPWDFASLAGDNRLEGYVSCVVVQKDQAALLCKVLPFKVSTVEISQVVAVNRYVGGQDVLKTLLESQAATMNFVYLKSGHVLAESDVLAILANPEPKGFLVGSMTLSR